MILDVEEVAVYRSPKVTQADYGIEESESEEFRNRFVNISGSQIRNALPSIRTLTVLQAKVWNPRSEFRACSNEYLQAVLQMSSGGVSRQVTKLVKAGLLKRKKAKGNSNQLHNVYLPINAKGRKSDTVAFPVWSVLIGLTNSEIATLCYVRQSAYAAERIHEDREARKIRSIPSFTEYMAQAQAKAPEWLGVTRKTFWKSRCELEQLGLLQFDSGLHFPIDGIKIGVKYRSSPRLDDNGSLSWKCGS